MTRLPQAAFDDLRDRARAVLIEDEVDRRGIRLSGRRSSRCGPCPVCGGDDRFSINTRKQFFNCRNCRVGGDVIRLVMHVEGVSYLAACKMLAGDDARQPIDHQALEAAERERERCGELDDARRTACALKIWREAVPAAGTPVETYLRSRGITIPPPPTLRFHHGLKHGPSGGIWPAMVAAVTRVPDHTPVAIHRTWLARDGTGKAPVDPQKMMIGPCAGGAVRLAPWLAGTLMVGEGIETCLSAMVGTGMPAWAGLSTSGMMKLELPADIRDVILLADGDDPGEAAARDCAWRWKREGHRARIARPPQGMDFNDLLVRGAPRIQEGAL